MTLPLFDVQCGFGGAKPGQKDLVTRDEWLAEMDRLAIGRALVRTVPEDMDRDAVQSNERLVDACRDEPRLVPCPVLFPSEADDLPPEREQVAALIDAGAGAVWLRPTHDMWSPTPWACGALVAALAERRMPAFCLRRMLDIDAVAGLAARYDTLPVILAEIGYRDQRVLVPLLRSFPNVHVSLGSNYTVHCGIERLVQAVGPRQLLFGTGFPDVEPMMAVTQLVYAGIGDEAKALIGAGNLERLLGGIQ